MKAKLDYLEYVALPWYTQIGYKIWRFLYFIVFALVDLVVGLAKQVWSFIKKIGVSIKKMYISLRFGDWATKLSFLFVGTGYIKRGQIVKGILYLIVEVAFILFMILFGGKYFTKFFTLGSIASAFTCEDVEGYWATKAEAEQARLEQARLEREKAEKERLEQERLERERLEKEKAENQSKLDKATSEGKKNDAATAKTAVEQDDKYIQKTQEAIDFLTEIPKDSKNKDEQKRIENQREDVIINIKR